jgi:glycosyltransferase involved in cell wall biosynthesis
MKILSFQPASLYQNGGMGRLLRSLYKGHENDVTALYINYSNSPIIKGNIDEIVINLFPVQRFWMRWKLRTFFKWIRESLFFYYTKHKIKKRVSYLSFDVLHVINQGLFCSVLCNTDVLVNKKVWTSFHDHYLLASSFKDTQLLWNYSDRRLMISKELGEEYQRVFGMKDFELITDGLTTEEISTPKLMGKDKTSVYFAGLMHIAYYPLLEVLADSLDELVDEGYTFELILRGTQKMNFLNNRKFNVIYRSNFITDKELKKEMDLADILYLPIKFSEPNFYLYSLSTKLISYLGASGKILFHGPSDSAACNLLREKNAAFCCVSLLKTEMIPLIKEILEVDENISNNAKKLAKSNFDLNVIQNTFWKNKQL